MTVHDHVVCENMDRDVDDLDYIDSLVTCTDAHLFGPCDYDRCGGCCVHIGPCPCVCHKVES